MQTLDRPSSPARHLAVAGAAFAPALVFAWLFYIRYWQWRECIAESLSSCVTPDGDNLTSGGMFWALPVIPLLLITVWQLHQARVRGRQRRTNA